jgi:hypothetical protein
MQPQLEQSHCLVLSLLLPVTLQLVLCPKIYRMIKYSKFALKSTAIEGTKKQTNCRSSEMSNFMMIVIHVNQSRQFFFFERTNERGKKEVNEEANKGDELKEKRHVGPSFKSQ